MSQPGGACPADARRRRSVSDPSSQVMVGIKDRARAGLRHAVDLHQDRAEGFERELDVGHRHRPGGVLQQPERGKIVGSQIGQLQQVVDHHRRQMRQGHAMGLQRPHDRGGFVVAVQHEAGTAVGAADLIALGADMVERHHQEHHVIGLDAAIHRHLGGEGDLAAMPQHRPLGPPGCAAGIDQIGRVVLARADRRRLGGAAGEHGLVVLGPIGRGPDADVSLGLGQGAAQAAHDVGILRFED